MPTPAHQNGPPAACPFFGPLEALPGVPGEGFFCDPAPCRVDEPGVPPGAARGLLGNFGGVDGLP